MKDHGTYKYAEEVLSAYAEGVRDFTDCEGLCAEDFSGEYLVGADFSRSNLDDGDFGHAALRDVKFCGACLDDASFDNADITGADFTDVHINSTSRSLITALLEQAAEQSPDLDLLEQSDRDIQHDRFVLVSAVCDEDMALCWDSTVTYARDHGIVDALRWALDTLSNWKSLSPYCAVAQRRLDILSSWGNTK